VLTSTSGKDFATRLADPLDLDVVEVETRVFSDGESKVRIPVPLDKRDVILVHSTHPPVDRHMMQLFFILSKVSKVAKSTILIIPYLAYARQDREFLEGEVISIGTIADIVCSYMIDALITFDAHSMLALSYFKSQVYNLSAIPLLAGYFKDMGLDSSGIVVVSPDAGGAARAEEFASILECRYIVLRKSRDRVTGDVSIDASSIDIDALKNKVAIIVDDMISTGSSVIKAIESIKGLCKEVYVTCTHALLLGDAYDRIIGAGATDIIASNTVPSHVSRVDVSYIASMKLRDILKSRIVR